MGGTIQRRWQFRVEVTLCRIELGLGEKDAAGEVCAAEVGASRERQQEVADQIFARVKELYAELDRHGRKGVVKRDRRERRAARAAAV